MLVTTHGDVLFAPPDGTSDWQEEFEWVLQHVEYRRDCAEVCGLFNTWAARTRAAWS